MAMKLSSGGWSKMIKPVSKLKASKPPRKKKPNNFAEGISEVEKLVQGTRAEMPLMPASFCARINR